MAIIFCKLILSDSSAIIKTKRRPTNLSKSIPIRCYLLYAFLLLLVRLVDRKRGTSEKELCDFLPDLSITSNPFQKFTPKVLVRDYENHQVPTNDTRYESKCRLYELRLKGILIPREATHWAKLSLFSSSFDEHAFSKDIHKFWHTESRTQTSDSKTKVIGQNQNSHVMGYGPWMSNNEKECTVELTDFNEQLGSTGEFDSRLRIVAECNKPLSGYLSNAHDNLTDDDSDYADDGLVDNDHGDADDDTEGDITLDGDDSKDTDHNDVDDKDDGSEDDEDSSGNGDDLYVTWNLRPWECYKRHSNAIFRKESVNESKHYTIVLFESPQCDYRQSSFESLQIHLDQASAVMRAQPEPKGCPTCSVTRTSPKMQLKRNETKLFPAQHSVQIKALRFLSKDTENRGFRSSARRSRVSSIMVIDFSALFLLAALR
ncbi:unnamed protein product [Calicophoron daubneyi]|uniref:Uncharacterized protein n=1 Tax=Calicophoron daubneyi TaxID=300641 RepID=A0AAV2TV50_CALDB